MRWVLTHVFYPNPPIFSLHYCPPSFLQYAPEHVARVSIIFNDERCAGRVSIPIFLQNDSQALPIDGLGQVVCRAQRVAKVLVVHDREHNDGDIGHLRIGLQGC